LWTSEPDSNPSLFVVLKQIMATEVLVKKAAHAAVVNDGVLSGEVAAGVCAALGLSSTNATLGRKMVSLALTAQDKAGPAGAGGFEAFQEQSTQFGSFAVPLLREIFGKVRR
jgi:hypothetical protein